MLQMTLNWSPITGFELDLTAEQQDIALRMAAVPVPADGRIQLREGVELDRLEILFKAQCDVAGGPGQLTEATVSLVEDDTKLRFVAQVEDDPLEVLSDEFDALVARMQRPEASAAGAALFAETKTDRS